MTSKDKDTKTMEKLLKQFFKFQKGSNSGAKFRDDFVLKPEYERDLSSEASLSTRIKTLKDLFEVVVVRHLDESVVAKLWILLQDLLSDTVARENRHTTFSFFSTLVQGQHDKLGIMRAQFFKVIKTHKNPEDFVPRMVLLQSLTDNGKDILHFEEEIGPFLLEFMHDAVHQGQEQDFLQILINVIKYNASYIDEDIINDIVESICALCCQSNSEKVVMSCLDVLDAIVCYSELPTESLGPFICTLCRTVNLENYCPTSWRIMRNLMGTHLGYSSLWTMKCILSEPSSLKEPGLLRGAVFYISMSLWSNSEVPKLNATPGSILPSFLAAVRCEQVLVMYEIVLAIYHLICKHEKELFRPVWTVIFEIMKIVLPHTMKSTDSEATAMLNKLFHETLTYIEELDQNGAFHGCEETLYGLISECSSYRPEASVKRLIDFMARLISPINDGWLDQLDCLLTRFYNEEVSIKIRVNVLSMLAVIISHNRFLYEKELVEITLKHLKEIHNEPDLVVRKSGTELLVNLFLNSETEQALELLDLLDKILNRALERKEKVREEDAEDIKETAHGLVRGLAASMYQYPSTVAIATFKLITDHLNRHYDSSEYLNQVTSIRHMMLECLLRLRADEHYRVGLLGQDLGFSHFLRAHEPPSFKRVELPPAPVHPTANPLMPDDHVRQSLPSDVEAELESTTASGLGASESFEVVTIDLETVFPVALATRAIVKALSHETDWKIMLMLLKEIPLLLKNRALFVSDSEQFRKRQTSEIDLVATAICAMICDKTLNLPERLVNTPPRFTTSDFQHYVFPVLTSLIPFHTHLEPTYHQRIIKCLECGLTSKCANLCVSALLICTLEMRDAMVKLLPEVLLCLSKISATVLIAVPILEFLSTLTQLPKVFANFVSDQYMSVFAIALPYTNPFKYHHYTVSLAHHVIAAWFLKCRLPFRRDFGKFITKGLKANILLPFEEGRMINREEMINEDSSNRKRSSSLTEQGSRRRQTVSPRLDLKLPDNNLLSFHKELTETCIDLMAMYAYSTCSPFPKRQSTAERILNGGRSMTWLVGHKLVTVTTSGCNLKALKNGLCDKCYKDCRVQTGSSLSKEGSEERKSKSENISTESTASSSAPLTPEEEKSASMEPEQSKIDQLIYGKHQEHQVCCCWCKGWSEIVIQRPTGSMSWSMRLQNEPHSAHVKDWKENGNSDISTLFLSSSDSKNWDEVKTRERALERVGSDPVSIPPSPIKRHSGQDDVYEEGEEGGRGSMNPVRRTNSSPDVTSNAKNPLLMPEPPELDLSESSKKISFPKDMRGNCEAIPEEMGTTPPATEAVLLAPHQAVQLLPTKTITSTALDTKPPVPSSSGSSRHSQSSKDSLEGEPADPASLPPLKYKRDRGHTISVMSPARKTDRGWELSSGAKISKPKESIRCTSGVNPAFVFLQLYHSPYFGCNHEKPILVPSETAQTSKRLSWIPPYEVHKIGVLYVGPGQANSEVDILQNEYGSPRYIEFLQRLGTLINLDDADKQEIFLGGLGAGDGKFSYIWQDDVMQVIFHVATLMPNQKNDPKSTIKKSHIGNDFTTIVYNDSGEEYNLQTISSQFNYAAIVIEPLEHGTNQIKVKCKEELASLMYHTDYKVISDQSVSILARQLALHWNLAAIVMSRKKDQAPYASNWLERLRLIKRIHNRLVEDSSGARGGQSASHHASDTPPHHFTNHIHDFTEYT